MDKPEGFFPAQIEPQSVITNVPGLQPRCDCKLTVTYAPGKPDVPSAYLSGAGCAAGVEIALAVALTAILKGATPGPVPVVSPTPFPICR